MPQSPTANMALVKPTENGDTGVWASLLDAMFDLIDQHDHTPGKGVKVPLATGAIVAGDVSWSSVGAFYAITNLRAVDFQPQPSSVMTSYAGALFCNSANNELTWRTTAGALVQITIGAALNIPGVGGFGGDYITAGALADFTDSTDTYAFRQQVGAAVRQYARVQHADVELFEYKAQPAAGVPTTRVRLKSPAALAASYDVTWLAALPGANQLLTVDNAGLMATANNATTALTVGGGLTAAVNKDITVSGTGRFKSGTSTLSISAAVIFPAGGAPSLLSWVNGTLTVTGSSGQTIGCPIILPVGSRILAIRAFVKDSATGPTVLRFDFASISSAGATTAIGSSPVSSGSGAAQTLTLTPLTTTIAISNTYHITILNTAGTANWNCFGLEVDYDIP